MRLPSGLLQGLATSFQSMASKANLVPGALDLTYRAAVRTIILSVSFILLFVVVKYVRADDVTIEPLSVPPKLQEAGYSGAVVANMLLREVRTIEREGGELESGDANSKDTKLRPQSDDPFSALATIQVPSSGLSVRTIADVLRDFFNIRERKVGGAITIVRPANGDAPALYRLALDLGPSAAIAATPEEDTDIEKAISRSARSIAREYGPVGLASYYVNNDREALKPLADALMKSADRGHRRTGLFVRGLAERTSAEKMARFREAIAEDPKFGAAYNALGSTLADMRDGPKAEENEKRIDEAIRMFDEAIRLNPSNAWAFRNRADVHRRKGCFRLAVADFEQATRLKAIGKIFFELGLAYEFLAAIDPSPAIKAYDEAIMLDAASDNPDSTYSWALNNRCYMRAIRGDGPAALADCNIALKAMKTLERYDSRGFAYLRLGDYGNAIVDYTAALTAEPKHPQRAYPLYGRGVARLAKGDDPAGGKADIEEARLLDCKIDESMAKFGVKAPADAGPARKCEAGVPGKAEPYCPRGWLEVIGL